MKQVYIEPIRKQKPGQKVRMEWKRKQKENKNIERKKGAKNHSAAT